MNINCNKKQNSNLGSTTGSIVNYMMGNNATLPEVGKGATILHWTDRTACEVISISKDGKRVIIQEYIPTRVDKNGMSESQQYAYEKLDGYDRVIVWKWGAWREESNQIKYTPEFSEIFNDMTLDERRNLYHEMEDENGEKKLIPGKTHLIKEWKKIKMTWGLKRHYHDYSF